MAVEPRIVFGGTFDPVHDGHLAVARTVRDRFRATVHFVPAGDPPHRPPAHAAAVHRLAMLRLAIGDEPGLAIDTRELARGAPSWTIDTVEELRRELPAATPLLLVIGMDSLRQFTTWKRWQDILAQAHLVACTRPGQGMPTARELGEPGTHLTVDERELLASPGGRVLIETATAATMAATGIRAALAAGGHPAGLAPAVRDYITSHRLYQTPGAAPRA
ncbi:MAG: nicotinate-nucleotide adenylyltransferase [Pseudomonadota bacterium]